MNCKVTEVNSSSVRNFEEWVGLSTDTKPAGQRAMGSTFMCEDKFLSDTEGWLFMWEETDSLGNGSWKQKLPKV